MIKNRLNRRGVVFHADLLLLRSRRKPLVLRPHGLAAWAQSLAVRAPVVAVRASAIAVCAYALAIHSHAPALEAAT